MIPKADFRRSISNDEWPIINSPWKEAEARVDITMEPLNAEAYAQEVFKLGRIYAPEHLRQRSLADNSANLSRNLMDYLPKRSGKTCFEPRIRDPRNCFYLPVPCLRGHKCPDSCCAFSHSKGEIRDHPLNRGRIQCRDGAECKKRVCSFSHSEAESIASENCWLEWESIWNGGRQNLGVIEHYTLGTAPSHIEGQKLWNAVLKATQLRFEQDISTEVVAWMEYLFLGFGSICPFLHKLALQPENLLCASIPGVADAVHNWASVEFGNLYSQEICALAGQWVNKWQTKAKSLELVGPGPLANFMSRKQTYFEARSMAKELHDNISMGYIRFFV